MSRIGEQRGGVCNEAVTGLNQDEGRIQTDSDHEGATEIHDLTMVTMSMPAMTLTSTMGMVIMVAARHAPSL